MKHRIILSASLALLLPTAILAKGALGANESVPTPEQRTLLYNRGDMGSTFWRIPALAVTKQGTVLAIADKRNDSNQDLPNNIDVALRRSTDGGATWSDPVLILTNDNGGGYGDAALGVHKPSGAIVVVTAHGNGLWESTADDHQHLTVTRSLDDGLTWSSPVDITSMLYDPVEGAAPIKALSGFASSGAMLCDSDGRLWFVLVARPEEKKWGPLHCYAVYSDDAGLTWQPSSKAPADSYGDESKLVQLPDGSLLMSIRNRDRKCRKISRSYDRGATWTEPTLAPDMIDPACNGDILYATPAQAQRLGIENAKDGALIQSLAYDPAKRRNVSILTSVDGGNSWQKLTTIAPFGSAYSALAILPDGSLGCLTEEDASEGGYRLWLTRIGGE